MRESSVREKQTRDLREEERRGETEGRREGRKEGVDQYLTSIGGERGCFSLSLKLAGAIKLQVDAWEREKE